MTTLQDYITQTRRLLHDANANFYSDTDLTAYINTARNQLVRDTGCKRELQTSATVTNQEVYDYSSLPNGAKTLDIININLYWGNSRWPLNYLPWSQFNAQLRYWQNYYNRPIAFSNYGPQKFYLGPSPDQVYTIEVDSVVQPTDLVSLSDPETDIVQPFQQPVMFFAAHLAKYYEQSYGESEIFKGEYQKLVQNVLSTQFTRRIPNAYASGY
jgi:hypothetical protein